MHWLHWGNFLPGARGFLFPKHTSVATHEDYRERKCFAFYLNFSWSQSSERCWAVSCYPCRVLDLVLRRQICVQSLWGQWHLHIHTLPVLFNQTGLGLWHVTASAAAEIEVGKPTSAGSSVTECRNELFSAARTCNTGQCESWHQLRIFPGLTHWATFSLFLQSLPVLDFIWS